MCSCVINPKVGKLETILKSKPGKLLPKAGSGNLNLQRLLRIIRGNLMRTI